MDATTPSTSGPIAFWNAHQEDLKTGDHLGGAYLLPPDLFVARRDRTLLEGVVRDILRMGAPESWQLLEVAEDTE